MRVENDVGSVAVGKYADLIAVSEDPIEHIETLENVKAVIKGGALVP
jgi:imidazolonepropionase-like amidohydrolase